MLGFAGIPTTELMRPPPAAGPRLRNFQFSRGSLGLLLSGSLLLSGFVACDWFCSCAGSSAFCCVEFAVCASRVKLKVKIKKERCKRDLRIVLMEETPMVEDQMRATANDTANPSRARFGWKRMKSVTADYLNCTGSVSAEPSARASEAAKFIPVFELYITA